MWDWVLMECAIWESDNFSCHIGQTQCKYSCTLYIVNSVFDKYNHYYVSLQNYYNPLYTLHIQSTVFIKSDSSRIWSAFSGFTARACCY